MDEVKFTNEKERYLRLDEAVRDSGIGEIYMIGVSSFVNLMHSDTPEEMHQKLTSYIEWAQKDAGTDPAAPGPLIIPLLALVSDEMEEFAKGDLDDDPDDPDGNSPELDALKQ